MRPTIILFLILKTTQSWATPKNIQMWFLKESALKNLQTFIESTYPPFVKSKYFAESAYNCVPMGDGCFHPQLGFIESKKSDSGARPLEEKPIKQGPRDTSLNTFNSDSVESVECDSDVNMFDIYCGKSKKTVTSWNAGAEIWIDVSSSFNAVDPVNSDGQCFRRRFVEALVNKCGGRDKINIRSYNTRIKEVGLFDSLCLAYGTNNTDMLIKWIEDSEVENLIIVTDASEISIELTEYLDAVRAKTRGADSVNLFAANLMDMMSEASSVCD